MWGDTKIFFTSKNIIPLLLFFIIFIPNYILSQELVWHSLNGPMGGIVGAMDINSNSEIFAGVFCSYFPARGARESTILGLKERQLFN